MTASAPEDSATKSAEEVEEAEAEAIFAEAAAKLEGKPADPAGAADETAAAASQETAGAEDTTGEGSGNTSQGQSGGSEGSAAAAAESGEGDLWADADPKLKAAYEAAEQRARENEQRFRSREGREAALQRQIDQLRRGGNQEEEQPRKPLKDLLKKETVEELGRDYPDLAPVLETLAAAVERLDGVDQQLGEVRSTAVAAATSGEEKALIAAVPNWLELAKDERFVAWVEDQPKKVRDTVADNWDAITDASAAAEVFTSFAEHIGAKKPDEGAGGGGSGKRERQAQGARPTRTTPIPAASGESDDPEKIFAAAAAKVERAHGLRT